MTETGAKSAAFVPLVSDDRVIAVISVATTDDYRAFSSDDLAVMQTLASEATIALERTRTSIALGEALQRERLLASIGRRLRTELDLDTALAGAVAEVGRALGGARCFVRLGDPTGQLPWSRTGPRPVRRRSARRREILPSRTLAAREERTVAIVDIQDAPELLEPLLGGLEHLHALGARAVASTPIIVQGRSIGVLTVHRDEPRVWSQGDLMLARGGRSGVRARGSPRPASGREPRPARAADRASTRGAGA